jgi:hypothetical protein
MKGWQVKMGRPRQGYNIDGEPIPGTTTICGMLNKPALVGWSGKLCTEAGWRAGKAGDPMPKWTDICYGTRDDAASAGTLVHELFDAYIRKAPLPAIPDTEIGKAAARGFDNAKNWLDSSSLLIEAYEKPLVSVRYRYGGTPDALAMSGDSVIALCDWKTSAGVYAEMLIQMAAYRQLLVEAVGTVVKGVHLVRFSRDHGDFAHYYYGNDLLDVGWQVFEALLALYAPLKQLEKRVK